MAGLVAGDSDSSALTQDSGDEGVPPPTPATDAGTEAAEDEDVEMSEQSPGTKFSPTDIALSLISFIRTYSRTKIYEKLQVQKSKWCCRTNPFDHYWFRSNLKKEKEIEWLRHPFG